MDFTKEQLSDVFVKHIGRERGLQELMELMIESMMTAERRDFHPEKKDGCLSEASFRPSRIKIPE